MTIKFYLFILDKTSSTSNSLELSFAAISSCGGFIAITCDDKDHGTCYLLLLLREDNR
jgi:hypothetical protein